MRRYKWAFSKGWGWNVQSKLTEKRRLYKEIAQEICSGPSFNLLLNTKLQMHIWKLHEFKCKKTFQRILRKAISRTNIVLEDSKVLANKKERERELFQYLKETLRRFILYNRTKQTQKWWFSIGGDLTSSETFGNIWKHVGCHSWGGKGMAASLLSREKSNILINILQCMGSSPQQRFIQLTNEWVWVKKLCTRVNEVVLRCRQEPCPWSHASGDAPCFTLKKKKSPLIA